MKPQLVHVVTDPEGEIQSINLDRDRAVTPILLKKDNSWPHLEKKGWKVAEATIVSNDDWSMDQWIFLRIQQGWTVTASPTKGGGAFAVVAPPEGHPRCGAAATWDEAPCGIGYPHWIKEGGINGREDLLTEGAVGEWVED